MRKTIVAMLAAAAVLVAGGAIGAAAQTDDTTESTPIERPLAGHFGGALLDEMVADGVITQDQADAIADWLESKREEMQAEREARRAAYEEAWSDGVLTEEEAARFPFGERLLAATEAWADGELTQEEFDALRGDFPHRRGLRHRFGA